MTDKKRKNKAEIFLAIKKATQMGGFWNLKVKYYL
jgi:hypothetical protein